MRGKKLPRIFFFLKKIFFDEFQALTFSKKGMSNENPSSDKEKQKEKYGYARRRVEC